MIFRKTQNGASIELECTDAIKGKEGNQNFVRVYNGGELVWAENAFGDNWDMFELEGGEWSAPPKTAEERISDLEAIIEAQAAALAALGVTE